MKKLMITAFEPFGGETKNPSLEAARQVEKVSFAGTLLRVVELPVNRYPAIEVALDAINAARPDVVIMLGEGGGRYRITPERVAINVDDYRIPDNAGNQPAGEPIIEGGPVAYFSTLPIRAITERLIGSQVPAEISNSAGTFLCNRLFYSVMHHISMEGLPIIAGFIHLPYMYEQVLTRRDVPGMSRETLVEGVRLAIEVALDHVMRSEAAG